MIPERSISPSPEELEVAEILMLLREESVSPVRQSQAPLPSLEETHLQSQQGNSSLQPPQQQMQAAAPQNELHLPSHLRPSVIQAQPEVTFMGPVFCSICRQGFSSNIGLARHHLDQHLAPPQQQQQQDQPDQSVRCRVCNKLYKNPESLRYHTGTKKHYHPDSFIHPCTVCGKMLPNNYAASQCRKSHNA